MTAQLSDPRCPLPTDVVEHRGTAMGSSFHVVVTGDPGQIAGLGAWAEARIDQLEQRWSRFISTSEVSRLNSAPGTTIEVSADTLILFRKAIEARDLSGGRFDPTMLQALRANGYDRTFVSIKVPAHVPTLDTRRIGFGSVVVDDAAQTITLGPTTGFDPGGIGKGLAADLVAQELVERGAEGALVNVGGDVRCLGTGPGNGTWVIAMGDDAVNDHNHVVELSEGAVATSTKLRRRWKRATPEGVTDEHHLLDPGAGAALPSAANLVSVIAHTCADAEWIATAIAAAGALPADRDFLGDAAVLLTDHRGRCSNAGSPERFLR